jgi:trk system potassium uptake protein TrkH
LLVFGYIVYAAAGWVLLSLPFADAGKTCALDDLFTAVSALSTTGLTTVSVADDYTIFAQIVILVLIQIGGLGYMTFGSFVILSRKSHITEVRKNVLNTSFSLPSDFHILTFIRHVVIYAFVVELIGATALFFILSGDNRVNPLWSAIFHSVSSFCTAGFGLYNNSFESYAGDFWLNVVISVLSIFGAVGYIVAVDVWLVLRGRRQGITYTSRIIITMTVWILVIGTVLIFITEPSLESMPVSGRLLAAFFQAMTALTTVGFNTVPIGKLALSSLFLVSILMIIGASPSGTGGGIKSTTVTALLAALKSTFKRERDVKFAGKIIPRQRVTLAICTFTFYIVVLAIGIFLLTLTEKISFDKLFFEAASALGTVGLSTGITAQLTPLSKVLVILLMLIGRVGPLTFGMALFYRFEAQETVEDLAI